MDIQTLTEWLDARCNEAREDVNKLNLMGSNNVLQYYLNNVYFIPAVPRVTFFSVPAFREEVERLYTADIGAQETARKLDEAAAENAALKDEVAALKEQVAGVLALIETLKPAKASKKAAKVEEPTEPETTDEAPAESE